MDEEKQIFFIITFNEKLNKDSLEINGCTSNSFDLGMMKSLSNKNKKSTFKYISEIKKIPKANKDMQIELKICIKKSKEEKQDENDENITLIKKDVINYIIKFKINKEQKNIIFLFDYSLNHIDSYKLINAVMDYWRFEKISFSDKFLLYYEYLLNNKTNFEKENKYYISLVNDFIEGRKEKLGIEIIISILIASYYDNDFDSLKNLKISKKNTNITDIRENNLINLYKDIYLNHIKNCIEKVKLKKLECKKLILEIIMIYFIKFNKDENDIKNILLNDKNGNREMFMDILKNSKNYIDYLSKINDNFEKIYSAISSFKSLKNIYKKFKVDYDVSQIEDINKFDELHRSLIEKQAKKRLFIIDFLKIFEKYFAKFEKYNNLDYICTLEKIVHEETKIFSNSQTIKDISNKYKQKILSLIFNNENDINNFEGDELIKILVKLKHHFNDKTFTWNQKKIILNYFIQKCKDDYADLINKYKNNRIFELFTIDNKEKNLFKEELKKSEFNLKNKFLDLFPEDEEYLVIQYNLLNKIIEKEDYDPNEKMDLIYLNIFEKNNDKFIKYLK